MEEETKSDAKNEKLLKFYIDMVLRVFIISGVPNKNPPLVSQHISLAAKRPRKILGIWGHLIKIPPCFATGTK